MKLTEKDKTFLENLKNKIFVGQYEPKMIGEFCTAACPNIEQVAAQPFIRFIT